VAVGAGNDKIRADVAGDEIEPLGASSTAPGTITSATTPCRASHPATSFTPLRAMSRLSSPASTVTAAASLALDTNEA
jgi:hypothetical protein